MIGPTLKTERLVMRPPQYEDSARMRAFFCSERAQYLGGPGDAKEGFLWFLRIMGHWQLYHCGPFALTRHDDDTILGMSGHWYPRSFPEPDVGWMLFDAENEGQGLATEAATRALDYAWTTLNWSNPVSYIHPDNTRAHALATRLGAAHDPDAEPIMVADVKFQVYRHQKPDTSGVPA